MADSDGSVRREEYNTERLNDVRDRVSRMEGRLESLASKEDVANAKFHLTVSWAGTVVAVVAALGSILGNFLS